MSHGRVLVTGVAGRLGRQVASDLAQTGREVVGLVLENEPLDDDLGSSISRFVRGNAADSQVARTAVRSVDAVVHLAAIPDPCLAAGDEVFVNNTASTFAILNAAAENGVPRAVVASSLAVTGMPFADRVVPPARLPLDVSVPTAVADPYALSKTVDEATAAMMTRLSGMTTTALRFPFLGTPDDRLPDQAASYAADPAAGMRELWSYLDTRDAARAVLLSLDRSAGDSQVVYVAASETLAPYPTEQLLDAYFPTVRRSRAMPGRTVPIDLQPAEQLLGFTPHHEFAVEELVPGTFPTLPRRSDGEARSQ